MCQQVERPTLGALGVQVARRRFSSAALGHRTEAAKTEAHFASRARVHGWAGWHSLHYVDPDEEAEFVAKDFSSNLVKDMAMMGLQLICTPIVLSLLGRHPAAATLLTQMVATTILLQMLGRGLCAHMDDQYRAATAFGVVAAGTTLLQWLSIIYVSLVHKFSVVDENNGLMLVLCMVSVLIQGLILGVMAYSLRHIFLTAISFPMVCAIHLVLHESPPGSQALLTKLEFFAMFVIEVAASMTFAVVQIYGRRIHLAELTRLADELLRQRDRLQFDLDFARKCNRGPAETVHVASATGGSEYTYGTSSEVAGLLEEDQVAIVPDCAPFTPVEEAETMPCRSRPSSAARKREEVLWATLSSSGIIPHEDDGSGSEDLF